MYNVFRSVVDFTRLRIIITRPYTYMSTMFIYVQGMSRESVYVVQNMRAGVLRFQKVYEIILSSNMSYVYSWR